MHETETWGGRGRVVQRKGKDGFYIGKMFECEHKNGGSTVITRKQWNRKTTLQQYLSVFDGVTKQIVLLDTYKITYLVKWVCLHCSLVLFHGHWTFLKLKLDF